MGITHALFSLFECHDVFWDALRAQKNKSARTVARRLLGASQVLLCQNLSDRQSVKGILQPLWPVQIQIHPDPS